MRGSNCFTKGTMISSGSGWSCFSWDGTPDKCVCLGTSAQLMGASDLRSCLVHLKNFQDSLSHRILGHMHEVLDIDKNKN